jgi:hypothetical protein
MDIRDKGVYVKREKRRAEIMGIREKRGGERLHLSPWQKH